MRFSGYVSVLADEEVTVGINKLELEEAVGHIRAALEDAAQGDLIRVELIVWDE